MTDYRITTKSTEHDWHRLPMRLRMRVAWAVIVGRPFSLPGTMTIEIDNARPLSPREGGTP